MRFLAITMIDADIPEHPSDLWLTELANAAPDSLLRPLPGSWAWFLLGLDIATINGVNCYIYIYIYI